MQTYFVGAVFLFAATASLAQTEYPSKPVRLIVTSAAGSGADILGRFLGERMASHLKGIVFIENKPGAGGAIAADATAKAAPDGYTIMLGTFTSNVLLPAVNANLPYNAVKDFAPIGQVGTSAVLLIAAKDFPASNLKELLALSKKSSGALQYASWGNGSTGHFCGELLNQRTSAQMTHIPYKTVSQIQNDIMGGHIKLAFVDMASGAPMVKDGRAKALVSCTARSAALPDVASYEDEGIGFPGNAKLTPPRWAMYAPAATPRPILEKLTAALKTTLDTAEAKAKLSDLGTVAAFAAPEELRRQNEVEIEAWRQVAKTSQITMN